MIFLCFCCIPLTLRSLFVPLQGLQFTRLSLFTTLNCRNLPLQSILLPLHGFLFVLKCILLLLELLNLRLKFLQAKLVFRQLRLRALQSLSLSYRCLPALFVVYARSINECFLLYLQVFVFRGQILEFRLHLLKLLLSIFCDSLLH